MKEGEGKFAPPIAESVTIGRDLYLVTGITESKVCQPLYRELEPLDGVVLVCILI